MLTSQHVNIVPYQSLFLPLTTLLDINFVTVHWVLCCAHTVVVVKIILIATAQSFNIYIYICKLIHFSSYEHIMYDPYSFHSFCSLSYDRLIAPSKARSPHSAIKCFFFQFPVSSHFPKAIWQLHTSCSSSSHPF